MATKIKIDKEFAAIGELLTPEEESLLEASIVEDGCLDPLILWAGHDILLDGHNRKRLCERNGIEYTTKEIVLGNREQAHDWIIDHQLGKRNVSEKRKEYLRGRRYRNQKKPRGAPEGNENNNRKVKSDKMSELTSDAWAADQERRASGTAEKLGKQYGVSARQIERDAKFSEHIDAIAEVSEEAKTALLSGTVKATRKEIEAVASLPKAERVKAATALASKTSSKRMNDTKDKTAKWPQMLKWAARQKTVTKESIVAEFGVNEDDVRKKLATVNQSIGYIVRDKGDGEYEVRRAVHFALDKRTDGDLANVMDHLKEKAEVAMRVINSDSSVRWQIHEQSAFVAEVLRIAKAFS